MKIAVLWDSMLDKFRYGTVERLNPESPNPLLNIETEEEKLWGAANVAANISSLNWETDLISVYGKDDNWKKIKWLCKENNIGIHWIFTWDPTISKTRFIDTTYNQQLLRVDREKISKLTEEMNDKIINIINKISPDRLVISDYNKWIISEDLIQKVKNNFDLDNILVDAKPANYKLFKWCYLIKPNFKEFCGMIWEEHLEDTNKNIEKYGKDLWNKMWSNIVITRWANWATLITKEWTIVHIPTEAQKVYDVTGAWDTFIAWLAIWLSQWFALEDAMKLWNKASGIVVWKVGTAIITKEEINI